MKKRILIKVSGEALGSESETFDVSKIDRLLDRLKKINKKTSIGIVVGGGNILRGSSISTSMNIDKNYADTIGMLSTIQNAIALSEYFNENGLETEATSSIEIKKEIKNMTTKEIEEHLNNNKVIIFAGGLGLPYFTTDTTSVQRALEMKADTFVMAKNGVDGVYDKDVRVERDATKYDEIDATDVIKQKLAFADFSAVSLAMQHNLKIKVVSLDDIENYDDDKVGTTINPK